MSTPAENFYQSYIKQLEDHVDMLKEEEAFKVTKYEGSLRIMERIPFPALILVLNLLCFRGISYQAYGVSTAIGFPLATLILIFYLNYKNHTLMWYGIGISQFGQWALLKDNITTEGQKLIFTVIFIIYFGISTIHSVYSTLFFMCTSIIFYTSIPIVLEEQSNLPFLHRDILFQVLHICCTIPLGIISLKYPYAIFEGLMYGAWLSAFIWQYLNIAFSGLMKQSEQLIDTYKTALFLGVFLFIYLSGIVLGALVSHSKRVKKVVEFEDN